MPELISVNKLSPSTTFKIVADRIGQNEDENYTEVRCRLIAVNTGGTESFFGDAGKQEGHITGIGRWGIRSGDPFLPAGVAGGGTRWDLGWTVQIGHGSDGRRGSVEFRMLLDYGPHNENHYATFNDFPRIARVPYMPGIGTISNVTSSSARVNGTAPSDDGGAPILEYQFQAATDSAFTAGVVTASDTDPVRDVTGLTPGQTYYFRLRARNRRGWSVWTSGTRSAFVGLPAPTLNSWTQDSAGRLVAAWSAPVPATGLTGYRLQVARDAAFTIGVQNLDLGNVTSYAVAGLAGGRTWYARVAARTAGGLNAYSASRSRLLVLEDGDLDGWTRLGVPPAAISAFTPSGIRRGLAGTSQSLIVENLATAATTLPANTLGIQRVVTGLTIGKAYRFTVRGRLVNSAALARQYRIAVVSEGAAAATTMTTSPAQIGTIDFVADATSVTLQIQLAETVTVTGPNDAVEAAAFHGISLVELVTDYPVRLRETVYESNLANHFDLACNSVGASWYVAKDGTTRFRLPGSVLPVSAEFTDAEGDDALHYIDVSAAYDTRGMVNRLDVTNYGVTADRQSEQNDELIVVSQPSIDSYGVRSSRLEVNLYGAAPYGASLNDRLAELLADAAEPRLFISGFRWNAQEDPAAANALEVGQRITVRFRDTVQDSQIVTLQHDITPRRWIVTVTLRRL